MVEDQVLVEIPKTDEQKSAERLEHQKAKRHEYYLRRQKKAKKSVARKVVIKNAPEVSDEWLFCRHCGGKVKP